MCCTRLGENTGRKNRHFGIIAQLCRPVCLQLRHISTIGKNLLNTDTSSTCPHNMVNFGVLAAEICWRVFGTPAHFNWSRVLAALLHGTPVFGVIQALRRWTECATYIWPGGHHVASLIFCIYIFRHTRQQWKQNGRSEICGSTCKTWRIVTRDLCRLNCCYKGSLLNKFHLHNQFNQD